MANSSTKTETTSSTAATANGSTAPSATATLGANISSGISSGIEGLAQKARNFEMPSRDDMREAVTRSAGAVRDGVGTARDEVADFVRARPYVAIGAAVGVGYVLAKLLSRRD